MRYLLNTSAALCLILITNLVDAQSRTVEPFHKVIISPFIQATFVQGDQESVTINSSVVDRDKLHIETQGGVLRLYLDGAKEFPRDQAKHGDRNYPAHAVVATIVYRKLDGLSLRGEEVFVCESPLLADDFTLRVYGESEVTFKEVHINHLHTTIYGESTVEIQSGSVNTQSHTCYGEGRVNTTAIASEEARLTAYGEADFSMNVSGKIKISSFGEAKLHYKGHPDIVKGVHFGGVDIDRLD